MCPWCERKEMPSLEERFALKKAGLPSNAYLPFDLQRARGLQKIVLHRAGVYFLCEETNNFYSKNEVTYVGQSKEVIRRLGNHLGEPYGQRIVEIYFISEPDEQKRKQLEQYWIKRLRPVHNKAGV